MGTPEVPHPVHEKLHRCVTENRETAWDYNPIEEARTMGKQKAIEEMKPLVEAIKQLAGQMLDRNS